MMLENVSTAARELFFHVDKSISKRIQIVNPKTSRHVMIHGPKESFPDNLKDLKLVKELLDKGYLVLVGDEIYEIPEGLRSSA